MLKDPASQISLQANTRRLIQNAVMTQAQHIFKENLFDTKKVIAERPGSQNSSSRQNSRSKDRSPKDLEGFAFKKKESLKEFID